MESMHTILVCLERLGIGGVETAVVNQVLELKKLGNKVIILAKDGIYKEMLEEKGIMCISYNYDLQNNYNQNKSDFIMKLVEEHRIDEVHIHQFPCALYVLPICLSKKIPYVLFLHTGQLDVYDWFSNTYPIYENVFELLFKYASKIVSITEAAKEYTSKKFNIPEERYVICNNGINFDLYRYSEKQDSSINKILLISRLSQDKIEAIKYAIDFYVELCKENKLNQLELTIVGDGEKKEEVEEYVKTIKEEYNITLFGPSNSIPELIKESDMVMTMGRGIIETIAMKRMPFIVGYTGLKGIVNPENIDMFKKENFTGRNKEDITTKEAIKEILALNYKETVDKNYTYLYENLNIKTDIERIYNKERYTYSEEDIVRKLFKQLEEDKQKIEDSKKQIEELNIKNNDLSKKTTIEQSELDEKNERIINLEKELSEVYNSKRWKYTDKISKIFH